MSSIVKFHEVRHCVRKYYTLGDYVLEVAKRRLDDMLYAGLTEDHKESATMFANVVGLQLLSLLQTLSSRIEQGRRCSPPSPESSSGNSCILKDIFGTNVAYGIVQFNAIALEGFYSDEVICEEAYFVC
ncbi:hypothetical protein GIB67_016023 [Kingdonia uniflora]|uniref:Uncharacterized protein n=1 Tax=Kingdonia uniflora TaxID=39325 RepID=A0A7J7L1X1_9MAGN|nr:hypothetical protein GIB67_016023 [Kingdonia uniflora]